MCVCCGNGVLVGAVVVLGTTTKCVGDGVGAGATTGGSTVSEARAAATVAGKAGPVSDVGPRMVSVAT